MSKEKHAMTRDALLFLPAKVAEGIILMLTTSSLYTAIFTQAAYGTYQIINTTVLFAYLIISGWLANAGTRYIGDEVPKDSGKSIYSTITGVYLLSLFAVLVVCLLVFAFTGDGVYLMAALMYGAYTLFQILNSLLVQLGKVKQSIAYSLLSACLKLAVATVAIFFFSGSGSSPYPALIAVTLSDLIAGLLAVVTLKIPRLCSLKNFSLPLLKKLLAYGFPLMGVSISVGLLNMIDRYLVVFFYGKESFAAYSANYAIASGIFAMINVAIMRGVYPAVLAAYRKSSQDANAVKPLLNAGVRLYLLVAVPAASGLCGISLLLSRLLFVKDSYHVGAPIIGLTAVAMVFMGLTEYANKAYELEASTVSVLQNSFVATVIKIVSSLMFLKLFGILGGAMGSILAFFSYFLITVLRVRRRFVFALPPKTVWNILFAGLVCFGASFALSILQIGVVAALVLSICAGGIGYVGVLFLSGEIHEELTQIKNIVKNRRK